MAYGLQFSPRKPFGIGGHHLHQFFQAYLVVQDDVSEVYVQYLSSLNLIRQWHQNVSTEPPGLKEGRVDQIKAIGSSQYHNSAHRLDTVHFG